MKPNSNIKRSWSEENGVDSDWSLEKLIFVSIHLQGDAAFLFGEHNINWAWDDVDALFYLRS